MARTRPINTTANMRRVLTVSLSVPRSIGIGPIIISPAPLVLPVVLAVLKTRRRTERNMMMNPKKMNANPNVTRVAWFSILSIPRPLDETVPNKF